MLPSNTRDTQQAPSRASGSPGGPAQSPPARNRLPGPVAATLQRTPTGKGLCSSQPAGIGTRSSEALVAACSLGDSAALGALFARFQAPVSRFLARYLGASHPDLDDLVQATFLEVMRAAPAFRSDAAVQTWIIGIAVNVARHHRRREARRQLLANHVKCRAQADRCDQGPTRSELAAWLQPALRALTDDLRTVFMMCELEELSGAEVARTLQLSEATLWRRLQAARKLLRQALVEEPPPPADEPR